MTEKRPRINYFQQFLPQIRLGGDLSIEIENRNRRQSLANRVPVDQNSISKPARRRK